MSGTMYTRPAVCNSRSPGHTGPLASLSPMYDRLDGLLDRLRALRPLPPDVAAGLRADWVIGATYNSNAIEGNTLTPGETKAVLLHGVTIGGKSLKEHLEAVNHKAALDFIAGLAEAGAGLTERDIRDIHRLILRTIDDDNAGRYRRENVLIGGAGFLPPDYLHVPEEMAALVEWHATAAAALHPVERAARLHADMVTIHPFRDGNGRTARLLMSLELMKAGFPPLTLPVAERAAYYDNLDAIAVRGDYEPFVTRIAALAEASFEPYWFVLGEKGQGADSPAV